MRMRRTKLSAVSAPGSLTTRFNNPRISRSTLLEDGTQELVDAFGSVRLYPVRRYPDGLVRTAIPAQVDDPEASLRKRGKLVPPGYPALRKPGEPLVLDKPAGARRTEGMSSRILMLVGPEYEDLEVWYPKLRLEEAGFEVKLAGLGEAEYRGKHGYPCKVDGRIADFPAAALAGIIAPGGWAPDKIRRDPDALQRVREVDAAGKMVATICHGPWVLISAGIVRGRRLTSTIGIRDDLVNAGAEWVEAPSVIDGNLVSSRVPKDLPAFGRAMLEVLAKQ